MTSTDTLLLYLAGYLISLLLLKLEARNDSRYYINFSEAIITSMLSWFFILGVVIGHIMQFVEKHPIKSWEKW